LYVAGIAQAVSEQATGCRIKEIGFDSNLGQEIFLCTETVKLHNEELHNLYSSPSIIRLLRSRRMRWTEHVARMGKMRNVYKILVGKPEGKRPLGRPRRRLMQNIKMDLREVKWDGMNWIDLAQDRDQQKALVNTVLNLRVP
jgi:hypothetical protein